jgi:hypothetical protein
MNERINRIIPNGNAGFSSIGDSFGVAFDSSASILDADGSRTRLTTDAITGSPASLQGQLLYRRFHRIQSFSRFKLPSTTNVRIFIGFTDQTAFTMVDSTNPAGNYFGMRYYSDADSAFRFVTKDGPTAALTSDLTVDTNVHNLYLWAGVSADFALFQIDDRTRLERLTNLPSSSADMRFVAAIETRTNGAKSLELGQMIAGVPV